MKIGEFSRLTGLPVKTIRYYSDMGLLIPNYKGDESNYRTYNESHIRQLNRIISLKGAGFMLKEIREIMEQEIPDDEFINMLKHKLNEAYNQELECRNKVEHLKGYIHQLIFKENEAMKVNVNELRITAKRPYALNFENNQAVIQSQTDTFMLETPDKYSLPLQIDVRAKTDSTNLRLYFGNGEIILNWEYKEDELRVTDVHNGQIYAFPKRGRIPADKFVEVTWIIEKSKMAIYVNKELRAEIENMPYMEEYINNPEFNITSTVGIGSAWGSSVTVSDINVREL